MQYSTRTAEGTVKRAGVLETGGFGPATPTAGLNTASTVFKALWPLGVVVGSWTTGVVATRTASSEAEVKFLDPRGTEVGAASDGLMARARVSTDRVA